MFAHRFAHRGVPRNSAGVSLGALALFFVLPALLLALLVALLLPAPPAHAATKTVCATGGDYTTIQAAVAAAQAGDVIDICAGTYSENVNLSAMTPDGDITLRGSGTVVITPTAGSAIATDGGFAGSVTLENLTAWAADADAVNFQTPLNGSLHVLGLTVNGSGRVGLHATVAGSIDISGTTLVGNGRAGASLYAQQPITVENSTFSRNGQATTSDGLNVAPDLQCQLADALLLRNVIAEDNTGTGMYVTSNFSGGIHVVASRAQRNGKGIDIQNINNCGALTVIDHVIANDNTVGGGIRFAGNWVQITNVTATGNAQTGIEQEMQAPIAQGELAPATADITLPGISVLITNTTASGNGKHGVALAAATYMTVTNVTARDNQGQGLSLLGAVGTAAEVANLLVVSNSVGVSVTVDAGGQVASVPEGGLGVAGGAPPYKVNQGIICAHSIAGLYSAGSYAAATNAYDNYWGALTGPYHPNNNPSGTGNAVVDSQNDGSGTVSFEPFVYVFNLTSAISPLIVGADNPLTALYIGSVYLGVGPGNLNDTPPFTMTVENGALTSAYGSGASVPARIDNNGYLTATVAPTASGPVTVTVTDPCGQTNVQAFTAQTPALTVSKTPATQYVAAGGAVTFTVDFTNTGTLALGNVIVTDTLAPGCNTSTPFLAPQGTVQVTCSVSPVNASFTNVVTVTAQLPEPSVASVAVTPQELVVSATATADVVVAAPALTAAKTAGTDANACAQPGPVTVPTGTPVYYCLRLTNSGNITLTHHVVSDARLGVFNVPLTYTLGPGQSLPITRSLIPALGPITITAPLTNTIVVTATGAFTEVSGATVPVTAQNVAAVVVNTPSTGLPPGVEPTINEYLFLPSLGK